MIFLSSSEPVQTAYISIARIICKVILINRVLPPKIISRKVTASVF